MNMQSHKRTVLNDGPADQDDIWSSISGNRFEENLHLNEWLVWCMISSPTAKKHAEIAKRFPKQLLSLYLQSNDHRVNFDEPGLV